MIKFMIYSDDKIYDIYYQSWMYTEEVIFSRLITYVCTKQFFYLDNSQSTISDLHEIKNYKEFLILMGH